MSAHINLDEFLRSFTFGDGSEEDLSVIASKRQKIAALNVPTNIEDFLESFQFEDVSVKPKVASDPLHAHDSPIQNIFDERFANLFQATINESLDDQFLLHFII